MARFDHLATRPARGPLDILRWKVVEPFRRRRADGDGNGSSEAAAPSVPCDGAPLRGGAHLVWIGHASFAIRLGGKVLLVDPVFGSSIGGVIKRRAPLGLELAALPPVDAVLLTHNHRDHWDEPSLCALQAHGHKPHFIVPLGNSSFLPRGAVATELDWWESHRLGELDITLTPARHWSMRMPWNRNDALWGGFVVRAPEATIYHSGDTALFDGFVEIGQRLGPIDYAMLPIGAYEPRWFMEPQHMNPEDAGEAFEALGAHQLVAMHWGTFKLTDEPLGEPPGRIAAYFAKRSIAPERLVVPPIGGALRLLRHRAG